MTQHQPRQRSSSNSTIRPISTTATRCARAAPFATTAPFAGKDIGEILVKKGEEGYVVSIGTFLQQFYIYGVEFIWTGNRVGMKRKELDPVEASRDEARTTA